MSTTDFFPPLVDDPADYGAIAAANACSDVFAMGGRVVLAINVAAFPEHFPRWAMAAIFDAAAAVVAEAGGTVAGGHTIRNPEPVFGLAVQGLVHPDRVFRKAGARPGDVVLLSKPLGTGLDARRGERRRQARRPIAGMRRLNRAASEALVALGADVHAVTDVTGYGLAGHGWEVAERSGVRLVVDAAGLVAYPGALEAAERGVRTGGDARNREYVAGHLDSAAPSAVEALCFDPQTSGGLLAAVDPCRRRRPFAPPGSGRSARSRPANRPSSSGDAPIARTGRKRPPTISKKRAPTRSRRARAVGARPRGRRRHRRGRSGRVGRAADGRRGDPAVATGGSTASATPSC